MITDKFILEMIETNEPSKLAEDVTEIVADQFKHLIDLVNRLDFQDDILKKDLRQVLCDTYEQLYDDIIERIDYDEETNKA